MASGTYVPVPARKAPLGGLLAVANVIESEDPHILQGVQYVPDGCEFPIITPGDCWVTVEPVDPEEPKTFSGIPDTPVIVSFVLHAAVECFAGPDNDFDQRARRLLLQGESFGVEQVLFDVLEAEATNVGTDTGYAAAIGRVEQWLGANYPGLGILHMDRRQTSLATDTYSVIRDGGGLVTVQGTPVANGAGYGTATGAARTPNTIWGTGQVNLWRSPIVVTQAINPAFNKELALAERAYAFAIDCDSIVKVTVS